MKRLTIGFYFMYFSQSYVSLLQEDSNSTALKVYLTP